ncbi:MAG: ABC transporter permease [Planctomycetaceae bacterium]|jgi:phospholipid/cholesterol/gamma-HCH transport system permease protein|nr:ABC transporter permease [Planctomycetaceae bacterium]
MSDFSRDENIPDAFTQYVSGHIAGLGQFAVFTAQTFSWLFLKVPQRDQLVHTFYNTGVLSLPVVMLTGMFIGMVLAVQTFTQFQQIGIESMLGGVISLSLVRELGPVLAAVMLAGRVGSAVAAELGTMRVTEQIDALTSMGTNPVYYLAVPRFLACLILIPALTVIADFTGVFGGAFYCIYVLDINAHFYWDNASDFVGFFDILAGMCKSIFFGGSIALISCYQGFHCRAGAEGVGRAATQSFVYSFVAILLLDLLLGIMTDRFMQMLGISNGLMR